MNIKDSPANSLAAVLDFGLTLRSVFIYDRKIRRNKAPV